MCCQNRGRSKTLLIKHKIFCFKLSARCTSFFKLVKKDYFLLLKYKLSLAYESMVEARIFAPDEERIYSFKKES